MRWYGFSDFKVYASAGIALVGLSAASTLLTDRVSWAQQPAGVVVKADETEKDKLELVERVLKETLGDNHPKLSEVRARLEAARAQMNKAQEQRTLADKARAEAIQKITVARAAGDGEGPVTVTRVVGEDGNVITEELSGSQVIVRRAEDGKGLQDVLATVPREVRGFSMLGNPKQNRELQKAVEKLKSKDASEEDKASAKEKIVSILGQQFDEDMEQRGKQIAELEKKVATLKEQIEKRKGARQRMIDLRVELLMNESEGLGFPSSWQQPAGVGPLGATIAPLETRTIRAFGMPAAVVAPVAPTPPAPPTPPAAPAPGK